MKVIVAGATGFVGSEIIRQALRHPSITSVIGLARRSVQLDGKAAGKFHSVVCHDFANIPDDVKQHLQGADACIW